MRQSMIGWCSTKGLCALLGHRIDNEYVLLLCLLVAAASLLLCRVRGAIVLAGRVNIAGRQLLVFPLVCVLLLIRLKGHNLADGSSLLRYHQQQIEAVHQRFAESAALSLIERLVQPVSESPLAMARTWRVYSTPDNLGWGAVPISTSDTASNCQNLTRLGHRGDGGKVACLDGRPALEAAVHDCLVISVGSNGDYSFEASVHKLNPRCHIDTWDGTLDAAKAAAAPPYVRLVRSNFDSNSWQRYKLKPRVAALKMDCEGCEYDALLPLVRNTCVDLLLIELHDTAGATAAISLLLELNKTFTLYYAEANPACKGGCNEYALRRRSRWCDTKEAMARRTRGAALSRE